MPAEDMADVRAAFARLTEDDVVPDGETLADRLTERATDAPSVSEEAVVTPQSAAVPAPAGVPGPVAPVTGVPAPVAPPAGTLSPSTQPAVPESPADPENSPAEPGDPVVGAELPADPEGSPAEPEEPAPDGSAPDDLEEPAQSGTMTAPVSKPDGWQVDSYELRAFTDAVVRARSYLDAVQAKADRMQGAEMTPQLGTSPVGKQLAKKFDDRLNSADGLRAMLAEAMKRMEDFVTSAEQAARSYEELEASTVDTFTSLQSPAVKHG